MTQVGLVLLFESTGSEEMGTSSGVSDVDVVMKREAKKESIDDLMCVCVCVACQCGLRTLRSYETL
jgi:hypothetical protein